MFNAPQPTPESIVLVVDLSSSAIPVWKETRDTLQLLYSLLPGEIHSIYLLGNSQPVTAKVFEQAYPQNLPQSSSLIAPIIESLLRQGQRHSVMIVGSGTVFDLDDWIGHSAIESWLLVQTGDESLYGNAHRVPTIHWSQIEDAETVLNRFGPFTEGAFADAPEDTSTHQSLLSPIEWDVDPTGYPLVQVKPLGFFVQLFPVTKPQFEKFLASGKAPQLNDEWYTERLKANRRVSYRSPDDISLERLLMTDITIEEATAFSRWLGREYSLLTAEEWKTCHEWLQGQTAPLTQSFMGNRLSRDARAIQKIIESQNRPYNLLPLSLMQQGILEWVVERGSRNCAVGDPASGKYRQGEEGIVKPIHPFGGRLNELGFRLCRRGR